MPAKQNVSFIDEIWKHRSVISTDLEALLCTAHVRKESHDSTGVPRSSFNEAVSATYTQQRLDTSKVGRAYHNPLETGPLLSRSMAPFTRTYLAGDFVMSAGSILFRRERNTGKLQICLIHQLDRDEWLLPKGRKDCGESIEAAAVRETYEETGYTCELVPLRMPTRATVAGEDPTYESVVRDAVLEPMSIVFQDRGGKGAKVIWWFVARVNDGTSKAHGTQMVAENYESHFLEAEQAILRLSFQGYRDIAQQALDLVKSTEEALQKSII